MAGTGPDLPDLIEEARAPVEDWDDAYANRAHVPGAQALIDAWPRRARAFRDSLGGRARLDLPYGPGARQRFDLFLPEGAPRGLAVFVHGGYWMAFAKGDWSHLAAGPLARGWAVAVPGYTLAPEAPVSAMTREIARFLGTAAERVEGPIALSGHSAGGHLAARMLCEDAAVPEAARWRIARALSISGVHDLRPIRRTAMNETLGLSAEEAAAESPALRAPIEGARLHAWVGGDERPEFLRQARLLADIWVGCGAGTRLTVEPGRNHFDVVEGLTDPDSPLTAALLD